MLREYFGLGRNAGIVAGSLSGIDGRRHGWIAEVHRLCVKTTPCNTLGVAVRWRAAYAF
jgi:hypothetical protein